MKRLERFLYEPMSTLTHLAGVFASLVGLVILLYFTWNQPGKLLSVTVYGVSMMVLYGASTVFHGAKVSDSTRMWLNRLDHMAIFLLIAGTYTPIVYALSSGPVRVWLLGGVWIVTLGGMAYKLLSPRIHGFYNALIYVVLSWGSAIPLLLFFDITALIPLGGWAWLLLGGLIYSLGFITYYFQRPDPWPGVFGHHEVWHLFVLGGSLCHFLFILWYVVPIQQI
ncbi:MAG: hemolysin III family protein [Chloroflexi bacterium]|nr:hemolysin III family protein [Chloroflexota bacterium]MBP8056539.1 hemolysin III family protein [Chloroflexota bacterium]